MSQETFTKTFFSSEAWDILVGGYAVNKKLLSSALLIIMISGFAIAGTTHFGTVKAATEVIGIIYSDTTWTKANSPYTLKGPVAVSQGVTLTIEPGTTVNLGSYYIQVNGTLTAIGSSSDPIHINGGSTIDLWNPLTASGPAGITFYQSSPDWNEQTISGSVIENAVFGSTQIEVKSAPKIANTTGLRLIIAGNPLITGNSQMAITIFSGKPTITSNNLSREITVYRGSPIITNNQITCDGNVGIFLGFKYGMLKTDTPYVSGNTITGTFNPAIYVTGSATVQNNLIVGSADSSGIAVNGGEDGPGDITVKYNTVVGCRYGVEIGSTTGNLTLNHNNFQRISSYYVYSKSSKDFDVSYNYWGTINESAISDSIYDSKYDFTLGTVNFQPILTAPDPNAPAVPLLSTWISISVDASSAAAGAAVNINGILSDSKGTPLQGKSVTLSYAVASGGSWVPIGSDITNAWGAYSFQWVNTASGTFMLKAAWDGDDEYLGVSANTTLSFLPYDDQNFFLVESNSTVTELFFNSSNSELSFTVNATPETAGYVKVTIPKSLLASAENVKAYLDGSELDVEITSNEDSWLLSFNYTHSTHQVKISLATNTAATTFLGTELWIGISAAVVIAVIGVFLLLYFKKHKREAEQ